MSLSTLSPVRQLPSLLHPVAKVSQAPSGQHSAPSLMASPEVHFGAKPNGLAMGLAGLAASVLSMVGHVSPTQAQAVGRHVPQATAASCDQFFKEAKPLAQQIVKDVRDIAGKTAVTAECQGDRRTLAKTSGKGPNQIPEWVVSKILDQTPSVQRADRFLERAQQQGLSADFSVTRDYTVKQPAKPLEGANCPDFVEINVPRPKTQTIPGRSPQPKNNPSPSRTPGGPFNPQPNEDTTPSYGKRYMVNTSPTQPKA
jgi:hypothetical protein